MGRLIIGDVVGRPAILLVHLARTHGLEDLGEAVREKAVLLELVLVEVHGDPQQRPAEAILVGGVEVEVDVTVARQLLGREELPRPGLDPRWRRSVVGPPRKLAFDDTRSRCSSNDERERRSGQDIAPSNAAAHDTP